MTDPLSGLCRASPARRLRIYPAHSFAHDDELRALMNLLEPDWAEGRDYVILAPRVHDPLHTGPDNRLLARALMNRMDACDLVWALAGRYATESPWIGFENHYTTVTQKPVLTIARLGQERLSTVATADGARPVARWRKDSIINMSLDALPTATRRELAGRERRAADPLAGLRLSASANWAPGALETLPRNFLDMPPLNDIDDDVLGAIRRAPYWGVHEEFGALEPNPLTSSNSLGRRIGDPTPGALRRALGHLIDEDE